MAEVYRELIGKEPEPTRAEGLLNEALAPLAGSDPVSSVRALVAAKPYVKDRIADRAVSKHLFRQPSILLAYYVVAEKAIDAVSAWPLTEAELKPIFADLGEALP